MSAADEDTELRDLLINTLENNGVLNKIKAELRASVFLALEEQDKSVLVNEKLRHFLSSSEGRLVLGLVTDFLQCFHLDFTMAVLQPEANLPASTHDERAQVAAQLGLPGGDKGGPLLLELIRHFQHGDRTLNGLPMAGEPRHVSEEPIYMAEEPIHIAEAQAKFELYDRDKRGEISKEELRQLLLELFPDLHKDVLDRSINEELSNAIKLQDFLALYRRLCKTTKGQQVSDLLHPSNKVTTSRTDSSSSKSLDKQPPGLLLKSQFDDQQQSKLDKEDSEGDSFFDEPIPKADKAYGWKEESSKPNGSVGGLRHSAADKSEPISHSEAHNDGGLHSSLKDFKSASDKMASLDLGAANDDDYADDFNSTSQRSDKSEVSIGEDLEEDLSAEDFTVSDHKLDDFTLDNSISHISDVADYLEDVS